jgi:hypothetical protein
MPTEFNIPRKKEGKVKILELYSSRQYPKSREYKLLTIYITTYIGSLIPI